MEARTQTDLEGLIRRIFPEDFVGPMLDGVVPGGEALSGAAAVFARLSAAAKRLNDGLCPLTATVGAQGTGTLTLDRTTAEGAPAGTLKAGTVLHDYYHTRVVLTADVVWSGAELRKTAVPVRSWSRAWRANLDVGTRLAILRPVCVDGYGNPAPLFDTTIIGTVEALDGAAPPDLELLGSYRRKVRQPDEPEAAFHDRIATVTRRIDPVDILALAREVRADALLFEGYNLVPSTGEDSMSDAQAGTAGVAYTGGNLDLTAVDAAPRYSDRTEGWFIIVVPGAPLTDAEGATMWTKVNDAVGGGISFHIEEVWYYTH